MKIFIAANLFLLSGFGWAKTIEDFPVKYKCSFALIYEESEESGDSLSYASDGFSVVADKYEDADAPLQPSNVVPLNLTPQQQGKNLTLDEKLTKNWRVNVFASKGVNQEKGSLIMNIAQEPMALGGFPTCEFQGALSLGAISFEQKQLNCSAAYTDESGKIKRVYGTCDLEK